MRWSPTANEGYGPKISPDGRFIAFGQRHVHLANMNSGDEWLLGLGGQPQWIRPGQLTYLEPSSNGLTALRHEAASRDLAHGIASGDQELYVGENFVADEGHWANAKRNGRVVYDGAVIVESGGSRPRVNGDYFAYVYNLREIRVQYGDCTVKVHFETDIVDIALQRNGNIIFIDIDGNVGQFAFGDPRWVHRFPFQSRERLLVAFESKGRPWVASVLTEKDTDHVVLRDLDRDDFFVIQAPNQDVVALDVVATDSTFILAATSASGRLRVETHPVSSFEVEAPAEVEAA